ncbi:phosphomannomutase/phosphoglucomutase [candidate division WOR-3 bacterium]|nr:phosphomannomutase/phosphoglucomutase [candidate division WOR-3 bacterium]
MVMNPNIFRTYDIRGVADTDLKDKVVYKLGQAYGTYISGKWEVGSGKWEVGSGKLEIGIGQDVRLSSPRIAKALIQGIIDTGVNVVDLGVIPTPVLYFSIFHYNYDGGIMVTGSHNPKEYNGFKVLKGKETIYGEEIQKLRKLIETENFMQGKGKLTKKEPVADYINFVKGKIKINPPQAEKKLVIDPGNGTCGPIASQIFKDLGCEIECIHCEPDGNFPAHLPDPTIPEYTQDLIKRVRNTKADFGIGYDGDGDRIGVIDELGNIIWGDKLLGLFAKPVLKEYPGAPIIFEVKCSEGLIEYIKSLGGRPLMWKTGHSLIKAKMKEENSPLAGEMSGHMFFADNYYGYDDAIFASLRLLEILASEKRTLSELISEIPAYYSTPEIRIDSEDELKFELVDKIKNYFKSKYPVIDIDGARIKFKDGWGLVRASNTQPILVLRFEAKTKKRLEEIKKEVTDKLLGTMDKHQYYKSEILISKS